MIVGSNVGLVEEVDTKENGFTMGRYARIRVRIDISKPLKQFIRVSIHSEEDDICVILVYERLPDFCYRCGCIGHSFRVCESSSDNKEKRWK